MVNKKELLKLAPVTKKTGDEEEPNPETITDVLRNLKTGVQDYQDLMRKVDDSNKLVTVDNLESNRYNQIKENISKSTISKQDVISIAMSIWNKRARFGHGMKSWEFALMYFYSFLPRCCQLGKSKRSKKFTRFNNGYQKFNKELDVTGLLRSVRLSKVLCNT